MIICPANKEADHKRLCQIARTNPYTKDFSNEMMFSGDDAYAKGWIRKLVGEDNTIVGFTCVRHKARSPETKLYFIVVDPDHHRRGHATRLMDDLHDSARLAGNTHVRLDVEKVNEEAIQLYMKYGYTSVHGDALKGKGWLMEKEV